MTLIGYERFLRRAAGGMIVEGDGKANQEQALLDFSYIMC